MMKMSRIMWCSSRKRKNESNYNYNYNYYDDCDDDSSRLLEKGMQQQEDVMKRSDDDDLLNNKAVEADFSLGRCSTTKRKRSNDESSSIKLNQQLKRKSKWKDADADAVAPSLGRSSTGKKKPKQQHTTVKKGDRLNLSQLLFTKDRDSLITYNDRTRPVQAKHLKGKVVVLHFLPLVPPCDCLTYQTISLVDIYNAIHPHGGFEVVFIGVKVDDDSFVDPQDLLDSDLEVYFEEKFSIMPWTAIPFSDFQSREYLKNIFPISGSINFNPVSFVIDPRGMVSQCHADNMFYMYGARSYPFTDERLGYLMYKDKAARNHPSISKLLASPKRNYVIDNSMQAVPLHTLEDKVVALYFFEDYPVDGIDGLTTELQEAYEKFAMEGNFEIVLVYIHDALLSFKYSTEESFRKRFSKMPWLALPFKDPTCKKLQRVFDYPLDAEGPGPDPRLVIIGPQGKFVERYGVDILENFGTGAYPFTRTKVAQLEVEYIKKLKLHMFWGLSTVFRQNDGSTVQLSQLVGKKIILIVETTLLTASAKFWRKLIARYTQFKGKNDEFEVIHICKKQEPSYGKHVATMSWMRHPLCGRSIPDELLARVLRLGFGLIAFDGDGRVVRRTVSPSIKRGSLEFPFYSKGLEQEVLMELKDRFEWDD